MSVCKMHQTTHLFRIMSRVFTLLSFFSRPPLMSWNACHWLSVQHQTVPSSKSFDRNKGHLTPLDPVSRHPSCVPLRETDLCKTSQTPHVDTPVIFYFHYRSSVFISWSSWHVGSMSAINLGLYYADVMTVCMCVVASVWTFHWLKGYSSTFFSDKMRGKS